MTRKNYVNVNAANQYARDVVRGKIQVCRYVVLACQRHLDDLENSAKKNYPFKFDKDKAERVAKFIQLLPHTKGEWAFKRMPITLEPWQLFCICVVFGWVRKKSGLRRFREAYNEIPRKNGKSAMSAGVGLYMFACDDEFGAEVYSGATTEKQAWEVFRPARLMAQRTEPLREAFGIEVHAQSMSRPEDGARFEPLIGDPGDGASPSCALIDEYHEHQTDALYQTMQTGMGARRQPLIFGITTAGYNIEGPCYDKRREVIEMLEGIVPNDELFGIIYTIDDGDDWTDPAVLRKANPNMGISVYSDYLLSQQRAAINNPRKVGVFKTKHLNIWVAAKDAFFNLVNWQKCEDRSLTLERFEGHTCILAFDLARKLDLNAMVRLFTREIDGKTHYYCVAPKFFVPYDTIYSADVTDSRTAERYQKWVEGGFITVTDGAEIDYREILESAKEANRLNAVEESPIDPHGYQTGRLARSIGYYVPKKTTRRPGLMVKISPNQKNGQGNRRFPEGAPYYPAFLYYGVRHSAYGMDKKDKRQKKHHSSAFRLAPRNNFMADVIERRRHWTQELLSRELQRSLRPVKRKHK